MKEYITKLTEKGIRLDGRKFDEIRKPIIIENNVSDKAEGSCKVTWGDTVVVAGIKMNVGTPYPDSADEGVLITSTELSPMADSEFLPGPPNSDSIELARIVDRGIRESKMIDMKKLCIRENELVWNIFLDIYAVNNAGNLIDVAALAAVSALKNAVFPKLEGDNVKFGEFTKIKLPVKITPITTTIIKIDNEIMIDPTREEEKYADTRLTIAISEKNDVHAMQKGGLSGLDIKEVDNMISLGVKKSAEIRKLLK